MERRTFIKTSSAVMAGLVLPDVAWGSSLSNILGANDRINVALIGCRSMGWGDLAEFFHDPAVRCVALCDVDNDVLQKRAGELERNQGMKADLYSDYRRVLDNKDVDAVVIGTPDHWHCLMTTDACDAGKHVYVEKPLANSIAECDAMVAAALRNKRVVQVGQQQRSGKIWHEMKKYIDTGALGRITKVNVWANFNYAVIRGARPDSNPPEGVDFDMWLGPAPQRSFNSSRFHGSWRMFWDYGGGLLTDWGVHLLDMALWGMNVTTMPRRVMATGGVYVPDNHAETPDTLSVLWEYDDFTIQWNNVAGNETGPYDKNYGLEFRGDKGTLVANREGWFVIPAPGSGLEATKYQPDNKDRTLHVANFLDCVRQNRMDTACTIQNGCFCAQFAHIGNIAARTHEVLTYDASKRTFHNKVADHYIQPTYRGPWKFPKLK